MSRIYSVGLFSLMLFLGCFLQQSRAEIMPLLAYDLTIAENEAVVANPNDMMAQKMAAWKTQHEMLSCRDMPYFNLINTSLDPLAAMTSIRIAIDPSKPYNFDQFMFTSSSPGITYSLLGIDTLQGAARSPFLEIQFTGFTPGKYFRFRTDIDNNGVTPNQINMFTDYRQVLFDGNGVTPGNNALVTAVFSTPNLSPAIQIPTMRLPEYKINGPFLTGTNFQNAHLMDAVQPFPFAQAIPEPSSWMILSMVWLASTVGYGARRRRKQLRSAQH